MSQAFIGEIRLFAGNFAPVGWAFCDGSLVLIADNEPLFNLIGTTYGGDGTNNFALPDLRGRIPLHMGAGFAQGELAGVESVTLTINQIPSHSHVPLASTNTGSQANPINGVWAASSGGQYSDVAPALPMDPGALGLTGGSQPHDNMPPFLVVSFIIALEGIFPV